MALFIIFLAFSFQSVKRNAAARPQVPRRDTAGGAVRGATYPPCPSTVCPALRARRAASRTFRASASSASDMGLQSSPKVQNSLTLFFCFLLFIIYFNFIYFVFPSHSHSRLPRAVRLFAKIPGMAWTLRHVLVRRFHCASDRSMWSASRRVPSRPFPRVRNPDRSLHVTLPNAQDMQSSPYTFRMEDYPCELIRWACVSAPEGTTRLTALVLLETSR